MGRSLAQKMMIAFLGVALLAAFVPALLSLISFHNGIFRLDAAQSEFDAQFLTQRLSAQYAASGNWNFLQEGPRASALLEQLPNKEGLKKEPLILFKRVVRPPNRGMEGPWWTALLPQLALLDANKEFMAGNHDIMADSSTLVPLYAPEGEQTVIGYLVHVPNSLLVQQDVALSMLLRGFFFMLTAVTLLTTVAVWLLARHFRAPIRKLREASQKITAGALSTRVPLNGKLIKGNKRHKGARLDEIQELTLYFNQMAESLELNEKSRRQWVADTSHELRTPLTVALGIIQAIRDGLLPADELHLKKLAVSVQFLDRLVEDLHFLARADAGKLDCAPTRVELSALVEDMVEALPLPAGLHLELNLVPAHIWADPARLRQVIHNILQNAFTYTSVPGTVLLWVKSTEQGVQLGCDDSPPCPTPEQMPHLFDRFYRCDAGRPHVPHAPAPCGSGLGLAISLDIVQAMNGKLYASPSPLGGLRLVVEFAHCHETSEPAEHSHA